jgi:CubicO group peptidase (beta-lactamase class C family)
VAVNQEKTTVFQKRISQYKIADNYFIDPGKSEQIDNLIRRLSEYDLVITGVYGTSQRPDRQFGLTKELEDLLEELVSKTRSIITWFGNPYALNKVECLRNAEGLLLAYQENEYTEDLSAQMIFGAIGARGSLPVTVNDEWPYDFGIITPGNLRMQYGLPENAGLSSEVLHERIDSIVSKGLDLKAFPGCEVMASRKGIVFFHKTYGFHTYDSTTQVREDDLYDLASLTKVTATTAGLMLLDSEGKFIPEETLGYYLPFFRYSGKGNLKMTEILAHQAGFRAWIPFWEKTVKKNGKYKNRIYDTSYSDKYPVEVAIELFIRKNYSSRVIRTIRKSTLGEKKYLYSDLGFIISPCIIETLTGEKWDDYISKNIYQKLGADDIVFNPYLKYPPERIIPTEYDSLFRRQLLHGTVHDEGAALLGGVSGHAGLFATANDLMKVIEMYRRMGSYGGEQIIAENVIRKYTSVQFPENNNRRGLGFDKPLLNNYEVLPENSNTALSASMSSFGHTGFTGTYVWVDPEYEISYVFLSNRVNPTRNNNLITELNIRTNILQAIYDSIIR